MYDCKIRSTRSVRVKRSDRAFDWLFAAFAADLSSPKCLELRICHSDRKLPSRLPIILALVLNLHISLHSQFPPNLA